MEKEEQERVKAAVGEILKEAKFDEVTTRKVRELAEEKTGIDLSRSRHWKKFVTDAIAAYVDSNFAQAEPEEEKPTAVEEASKEKVEEIEEEEDASEEEEEDDDDDDDDEEEERGGGKRPKYEKDEEGNYTICELSAKRKVVVSQFKGKTLISMREFYEKDGKVLPTSKGISLTAEQFQVLAKAKKDIDKAISSME